MPTCSNKKKPTATSQLKNIRIANTKKDAQEGGGGTLTKTFTRNRVAPLYDFMNNIHSPLQSVQKASALRNLSKNSQNTVKKQSKNNNDFMSYNKNKNITNSALMQLIGKPDKAYKK